MSQITACLLFILLVLAQAYARDTITPSESLNDGDLLVSSDETFALGFFSTTPGHKYVGIWYNNISVKTKVWVANRQTPITDSNVSLVITSNGTLAVTTSNSTILWSVNSSSSSVVTNPVAKLLDTGNFVVTSNSSEESFAWQSFDYPTDTLLPGMKLGYDLRTGLNRNLTAWKSETDPSPGDDCVAMNIHGDPELTVFFGYVKRWRSGPWTGDDFNGIPEMSTYTKTGFSFKFVDNSNEIYYSYDMSNKSILTRLMANNTGRVQRWVWTGQTWSLFWSMPNNACEYGKCGAYSTCDPNASPICACLDGFEPKSSTNWNLGDWSDGCMRKHRLDCVNGTDGFLVVKKAMLPDTSNSTVDRSLSLDQCRTTCLRNCSCTGYSNADVRNGGSGCIIWSTKIMDLRLFRLYEYGGQDFFVRLAAQDIESNSHESKTRVAIITVCTVVGFLLLVLTGYCILKRKKSRGTTVPVYYSKTDHNMGESNGGMKDVELPLIDFGTLMTATNNFSTENLLGEGGFGPVYKGKIGAGQEIAVKRLSKDSVQGIDEFKNEVMLIAKLQHRNLVRLQGYCIQGEEIMLIYEYMANGSLDAFLFDKSRGTLLDWKTRFHIIAGVARGLLYLHQDSRLRVIHRDLKASNILLDKDMNPKISDFGMARISAGDEIITKTRRVVGTYGYMSPEYAMDGIFSVKSDVYSYGVLVLELISGQKNRGVFLSQPHLYLLGNAWKLWNEGRCLELIDPLISSYFSQSEVMKCIHIGLLCVQECPEDRPTMQSVAFMIDSSDPSLPKPKKPGFIAKRDSSESSSCSTKKELYSVDDETITAVTGR
ncbi:uncharacterized protein A4U43_C09F16380 [Asparagus officinalis]|uniref:Receptor-like serine/threonine-protein kinase n=1 Tax=Asparagus officinalis TaxID=4686 RepID=A0A5P1E7Z7_ASPOF|nr:G-type lectin S-receptor-like serine/threonine-protein kinase At4g27290 [Asparagus officinalis]ONK58761.1 uncharacterized protein A4U43_C09F16380 [Asparagus officinalis]